MNFDQQEYIFSSPGFSGIISDAVKFFVSRNPLSLKDMLQFSGAGVYGLYYSGDEELYQKISAVNQTSLVHPIYIGKAVPPGWRTGRQSMAQSNVLFNRLKQHSYSINQVDNLQIEAFWCRLAILTGLEADLIVPLEAALIRKYQPLWNTTVDGFGNHDPGRGRYQQAISDWDLLHPGRPWATHLTSGLRQREQVIQKVAQYQINKG